MRLFLSLVSLFFLTLVTGAQIQPYSYNSVKKVVAQKGAVVSAHPLASAVGLQILQQGGNAFDAAVATQLALAVVYPGAGNLGGGGFLLGYTSNGKAIALDFREKAPAAARHDMYLDSNGNPIAQKSQYGHLASGVPGTVSGLFSTLPYTRLPFAKLIEPAIELAKNGFAITEAEARNLNGAMGSFIQYSTRHHAFIRDGGWKAGDTLIQPQLAATLQRIRKNGRREFYEGKTAQLLVAEMKHGGGLINHSDLKNYQTAVREVMRCNYRGYTVIGMPLVSSGGILIQQMLGMTQLYPIATYGFQTASAIQLMVEVQRRAFADRAEYLGDVDFVRVPVRALTSTSYLQQRMKDFVPGKAGNSSITKHGIVPGGSEETTHLSIYDQWGNAVAVTTTLNGNYGNRTVVGGAGFLLNNEMDDFSSKPGVPNMYGALGTTANAIEPNKRMLSSMTPTIVLKENKPYLVLGSPGGTTIPTQVYQVLVNIIDFEMTPEAAVWAPRFHHQWQPDVVYVERDFPSSVRQALQAMGYTITERGSIGRFEAIQIMNGNIIAVADTRGDDHAAGY